MNKFWQLLAAAIVLGLAAGSTGWADEPAAEKTVERQGEDFQRELVFEESSEKRGMGFNPDMELPRNRYVAIGNLTLKFPCDLDSTAFSGVQASVGTMPKELTPLVMVLGGNRFFGTDGMMGARAGMGGGEGSGTVLSGHGSLRTIFERFVDRTGEALRPDRELVSELFHDSDSFCTWMSYRIPFHPASTRQKDGMWKDAMFSQNILAPTPERARELFEALVVVLDEGFSRQCHEAYIAEARRFEGLIQDERRKIEKLRAERVSPQKEFDSLKDFEDLSKEAVASLTAHKRMIAVNLAGIGARLRECKRMLAEGEDATAGRIDQVETAKIAAEIEHVGLQAEKDAIDEILAACKRRAKLYDTLLSIENRLRGPSEVVRKTQQVLDVYRRAIEEKWAFLEISKITIQPIRWMPYEQ